MMSDDEARDSLGRHVSAEADSAWDDAEDWLEDTDSHVLAGARLPAAWRFLWHWFALLEHRVVVADRRRLDTHDVRIGREPHDWWLEVRHYEDAHLVRERDVLADNRVKRFRALREAVVLLSIFAEVDYDAWLAELVRTAKFAPVKAMDLTMHRLPCKWAFDFSGITDTVRVCQWTMLRDLFGFNALSKEFKRDFARAAALARAQKGLEVSCMEPIAIKVVFMPSSSGAASQIKALAGLAEIATQLLALETEYMVQRQDPDFKGPPVFRVERFDAELSLFEFNTNVLAAIQRFLETGLPIHTLQLPCHRSDRDLDPAKWLPVWGSLLQSIMGIGDSKGRVRRLVAYWSSCQGIFLQPLLSALMATKTLKYIHLAPRGVSAGDGPLSKRLWAWLGVALLNPDSTSSVQALELSVGGIHECSAREVQHAKEATRPLHHLWRACTQHGDSVPLPAPDSIPASKKITVMKGAKLFPQGIGFNCGFFEAPEDIHGFRIEYGDDDDDASTKAKLVLPGYGLCAVDKSFLPSKRQRVNPRRLDEGRFDTNTSLLSTFIFNILGATVPKNCPNRHFADLLGVVGSSLSSLGIYGVPFDDATLESGLLRLSRLENLRLNSLTIESMQPLIRAYHRGIKISSLDLRELRISSAALIEFLTLVGSDKSIREHLLKLRFGSKWATRFDSETRIACTNMLTRNNRLQYFHVYQHADTKDEDYFGISLFHHDPVIPCFCNRLAFISALRHRLTSNQIPCESIIRILEFAATERKFVVEEREPRPGEFW